VLTWYAECITMSYEVNSAANKTLSSAGTFDNSALRDSSEYANRYSSQQRRSIRVHVREDRNRCSLDGIAVGRRFSRLIIYRYDIGRYEIAITSLTERSSRLTREARCRRISRRYIILYVALHNGRRDDYRARRWREHREILCSVR